MDSATSSIPWNQAPPYHDLDVGESVSFVTASGESHAIVLDDVGDRSLTVSVDGSRVEIPLGHFGRTTDAQSPGDVRNVVAVEGVRIGADVTRSFMQGTMYSLTQIHLQKDARIYIGDAACPISPPGEHIFPLPNYAWNFADNWLSKVPYGWHLGIDLNAERGTPIMSIANGAVVAIRHYDAEREAEDYWGINIGILGDDGVLYCYMHSDNIAAGIAIGARVRAGDVIGPLGRSGFETKPFPSHLHLEMMIVRRTEQFYFGYELEPDVLPTPNRVLPPEVDGHVINPYPYLVEWYLGRT